MSGNSDSSTTGSESTDKPAPSTADPTKFQTSTGVAFHFWFYIFFIFSVIAFSGILLRALSPQDQKTWFLNLPDDVRDYYRNGRTVKVQIANNQREIEIFSLQKGPSNAESCVLIVHGIGCSSFSFRGIVQSLSQMNVHALAIDLPGSGFSDRSYVVVEESKREISPLDKIRDIVNDIKEKGLFWGFDQLVQQGYVNFEETAVHTKKKEITKPIDLTSEEIGRVIGQVIDALDLAPVDLVLHDSAFGLTANWIIQNRRSIRSLLLLDSAPNATAFPVFLFQVPVLSELLMGFGSLFKRVLNSCCMKQIGKSEAEAHRVLLQGKDWGTSVFRMAKKLNTSFDLSEWSSRVEIKDLPIHVIWSQNLSSEIENITATLPRASVSIHSGGRWVQEHNSQELAQHISKFISSLPRSTTKPVEDSYDHEPTTEAGNRHDDHSVIHPGYADAYGLGNGWSISKML